MKLAIEAVNSNDMNPTEAAKVYQVPRQTLVDRINGKFGKEGAGRISELTHDEEQVLVNYCLFMAKRVNLYQLHISRHLRGQLLKRVQESHDLMKQQDLVGSGRKDFVIDIQKLP